MKRILILVMVLVSVPVSFAAGVGFSDVLGGDWYVDSLERLYDKGLIEGYEDGTFRPNDSVSRGEMVVLMDRLLNYVENGGLVYDFYEIPGELDDEFESGEITEVVVSYSDLDSYDWLDVYDPSDPYYNLDGDILTLSLFSCGVSEFDLLWDGEFYGEDQNEVKLVLDSDLKKNDPLCEAYVIRTMDFNLSGLPSDKELVLVVEDLRIPYVSSGN